MEETQSASLSAISKTRLEFLFDGIFAIAMTILVLELKVPDLVVRNSIGELAHALVHHYPTFASYLFSFLMLGMFWYRHNLLYQHFQKITQVMLVLHLVQLAAAAFFPFCAALLGRYPTNPLSPVFYIGCVFVYVWATLGNWVVARRSGALRPEVTTEEYRKIRGKVLRGCLVISMLLALQLFRVMEG